jgi:hypothetical protein
MQSSELSKLFDQAQRCISLRLIERYFSAHDAKYIATSGEYATLSPLRKDKHVKSGTFSINVNTGLWRDWATGDCGNFFDLVAKAFNISKVEAAKKIIADSGGVMPDASEKKEKKKKKEAIVPVPEDAKNELAEKVKEKYFVDTYGEPVAIYPYRNYEGELILCVCRYERDIGKKKKEKSTIPFYYTSKGWVTGRPDNVRIPLFHENKLRGNKHKVLIVEGEKCANVEVEGFVVVTWIGGTGNVNRIDFSVLDDREVYIWPDADEVGLKAAKTILEKIPSAKLINVENKKDGWDIVDAVEEGIDIVEFINANIIEEKEQEKIESLMTPYDAFHAARKALYGENNLEQIDGIFYVYDEKKHYWQERLKINIESDIQKWIEIHLVEFLDNNDKAIHTYIQNTISFLSRYSRKFYSSNPFKDSALKPYIHVKNGAVEITDDGFIFHSRQEKGEDFFRELYPLHCLDFDFDIALYNRKDLSDMAPAFYHYIKSLVPQDCDDYENELNKTIDFFSQVIAYCINPVKRKPRFFALYGGQNTGKSFFIELLQTLIGSEFFVSRRIKDMDNRFASSDLWGAKIFVDDDVKANLALPDDFIKNYSGQRNITIEKKNKDAIKGVRISVAMFFISNHAFSVAGGVEGLERRLVYIPYKKKIKNPDVYLLEKICGLKKKGEESGSHNNKKFDERSAILGFALRGIELLIQNNFDFITPQWVENERSEWVISSSSITQFLHEEIYCGSVDSYRPKVLYDMYSDWCVEEKRTAYGRNNFYEKLKLEDRITFVHTRDGDIVRIKLDDSNDEDNIIEDNDDDDVIPF